MFAQSPRQRRNHSSRSANIPQPQTNARALALEYPIGNWGLVGLIVVTSLVVRIWIAASQELFQDEALYYFIGLHLPGTFSPHPPGVPLLARLSAALFGRTELSIRIPNLVFLSAAMLLFYALARELVGVRIARWAFLAFAVTPIYFAFGTICTPDAPQLFFWILTSLALWRAIATRQAHWWIGAGVALGVGLYFKYILILVLPSLALFLLLSGKWRGIIQDRNFWIFLGVAGIIFVPIALWRETAEGWPALRYHLHDRQTVLGPSLKATAVYLGVHLAYYSPILYIAALVGATILGYRGYRAGNRKWLFVFSFFVVPWLFFFVIASMTRRELSREQWDAPAYVMGLIAAAAWFQDVLNRFRPSTKRRWIFRLGVVSLGVGATLIAFVAWESVTRWPSRLIGRFPLFSAMVGWRTMANALDQRLAEISADEPPLLIGNSFILPMQYAFYGKLSPPLYTLDNSQNRKFGVQPLLDRAGMSHRHLRSRMGRNALFVAEDRDARDTVSNLLAFERKLRNFFDAVTPLPPVEEKGGERVVKRFLLFLCKGLHAPRSDESNPDRSSAAGP